MLPYKKEENTTPCDICTNGQLADVYCSVCDKKLCTEHEQVCRSTWSNITYIKCVIIFYTSMQGIVYLTIPWSMWLTSGELFLLTSGTCSADVDEWRSLITREKLLVAGWTWTKVLEYIIALLRPDGSCVLSTVHIVESTQL